MNDKKQMPDAGPSAPPSTNPSSFYDGDEFVQCPPPPTYEESLRMNRSAPQAPVTPQLQHQSPPPPQYGVPYGYANPYQTHMQQQQQYYYQPVAAGTTYQAYPASSTSSGNPKVLTLAKGAKIRTTAGGAVSIPPPPPGCAPTPAQYAAMQGQHVVVKKTKNSFF